MTTDIAPQIPKDGWQQVNDMQNLLDRGMATSLKIKFTSKNGDPNVVFARDVTQDARSWEKDPSKPMIAIRPDDSNEDILVEPGQITSFELHDKWYPLSQMQTAIDQSNEESLRIDFLDERGDPNVVFARDVTQDARSWEEDPSKPMIAIRPNNSNEDILVKPSQITSFELGLG